MLHAVFEVDKEVPLLLVRPAGRRASLLELPGCVSGDRSGGAVQRIENSGPKLRLGISMKQALLAVLLTLSFSASAQTSDYRVYTSTASHVVYSDCSVPPWTCSNVDPVKMQEKKEFIRSYWTQIRWLGGEADLAYYDGSSDAAKNVRQWLVRYAENAGLLQQNLDGYDESEIYEGYYQVHYSFGAIALSYYKIKSTLTVQERGAIESWMRKVVDVNFYDHNSRIGNFRVKGKNNHYYALSTGIMAAGVVLGDRGYVDDAIRIIDEAVETMRPDGSWKSEMNRGKYSGHYQMMLLSYVEAAANIYAIVDRAGSAARLKALAKAELFTARLITDEALHKQYTGAGIEMDYDFSPKSRCTGLIWAWANLTENTEAKAVIDARYAQAYTGCNNDYMIGGDVAKAKARLFK